MEAFDPYCPQSVADVAEKLKRDVPPAPFHRHANSNPKETQQKKSTQCQYCFKSKGPGVILYRCSACEIDLYCSKECQRAAWKTHKTKCAINQSYAEKLPKSRFALKALRAFTGKHRPTLSEAGIRALGVTTDPSRAERDVLLVLVRPRLDSPRVETTFCVTAVSIVPLSGFPQAEEMRGQLQRASEENRRGGSTGALLVMLMDPINETINVMAVGFKTASRRFSQPLATTWEEWLTKRLNEGVVV
ncbi:hypothetical protein MSAN_00427500 [Mycena sanguinolenta]|uniref:MYND-type domain-containing protein n=1 Tax=Mycena sanguinolenta TaxID=230812 RepID=A0A8H7DHB2_9AGAR|nr:hypothetical protein MSAN_00427500 [Mycena sanguinolenta]